MNDKLWIRKILLWKTNEDKLGYASVKLLVCLKFTKTLSDFITKKDMKFFFQIEKGKCEPGIIIIC